LKQKFLTATVIASACVAAPTVHGAEATGPGPYTTEPFQAYVSLGGAYEDNLFRFSGTSEAEETLGTDQMDDYYGRAAAGFRSQHAGDDQRYELAGEVNHQAYAEFDTLDYTGGSATAFGEWSVLEDGTGSLQYKYNRSLQSFTNKDNTVKDIMNRHTVDGVLKKPLAQRWQLRLLARGSDVDFSTSEFLSKKQTDGEAEIIYAASQQSTFGLLTTYTASNFDDEDQDFSGWSIGPTFDWQIDSSLLLQTNVGYTHRGLDSSTATGVDDYDGVTGFAAATWEPGPRFATELRVFRDVSSLGDEISQYTERTGVRFTPTWQLTSKLTSELSLAWERRDFSLIESDTGDREDDYLLLDLSLDFAATQKLLFSLGYGYEHRDSNLPQEDFGANIVYADVRFEI
jgi:hypothetical protein